MLQRCVREASLPDLVVVEEFICKMLTQPTGSRRQLATTSSAVKGVRPPNFVFRHYYARLVVIGAFIDGDVDVEPKATFPS